MTLTNQFDMRVEGFSDLAASDEMSGEVERHVMVFRHACAAPAGEQGHVDEAHDCAAVDRSAEIEVTLRREDAADRPALAVWPEQQLAGGAGEGAARELAPAEPAGMIGIGRRSGRKLRNVAQAARSAISFLVSAIALAGFKPFGQTFAQFMIVWQR